MRPTNVRGLEAPESAALRSPHGGSKNQVRVMIPSHGSRLCQYWTDRLHYPYPERSLE